MHYYISQNFVFSVSFLPWRKNKLSDSFILAFLSNSYFSFNLFPLSSLSLRILSFLNFLELNTYISNCHLRAVIFHKFIFDSCFKLGYLVLLPLFLNTVKLYFDFFFVLITIWRIIFKLPIG